MRGTYLVFCIWKVDSDHVVGVVGLCGGSKGLVEEVVVVEEGADIRHNLVKLSRRCIQKKPGHNLELLLIRNVTVVRHIG